MLSCRQCLSPYGVELKANVLYCRIISCKLFALIKTIRAGPGSLLRFLRFMLMATYQHQPLSENKREIRLLRFDNSRQPQIDPGDTIALCLEQVSLNDKPEYTALSYVWGDTTLTEPIRVNGYEFRVTGNLHALLQQLRVDTSVKRFWVDAICINQKDGDEKSWQVQQMKDTFQNAANVFIWLGPSSESSGQAMDQLKSIGATALKTKALQILEEPLGSRDAWRARLSRVLDRKQPEAFEEGTVESC